jgi:gliding motility-associated-like protein
MHKKLILKYLQILILSIYKILSYRNKFSFIPKLQSLMARRLYTLLIVACGLLSIQHSTAQITFYTSPSSITPNVGDVVGIDVAVKNFTNIDAFQYTMEWDGSLLQYVSVTDKTNLPDNNNLLPFLFNPGMLNFSWNPSTTAVTLPNDTKIYRVNLRVLAPSTNYWMTFSGNGTAINVAQNGIELDPSVIVFGSLGVPPTNRPLSITTSTHQIPVSGNVCVGVTASDFTNLTTAQWSMKWDSSLVRFDSITKRNTTLGLNLANFTTTQAVSNGRLSFNFTSATPRTVPAGDTLFKICYTAIGANNTSTPITTLSAGANIIRSVSGVSSATTLNTSNGIVTIKNPPAPGRLTFSAQQVAGNVGDTVCVRVFTKNFKELALTRWIMRWDATKIRFVKARLLNPILGTDSLVLPNPSPNAFYSSPLNRFTYFTGRPDSLSYLWDDPSANGVTFTEDSTLIFDICFRLIGAPGTTSSVVFDRNSKIEVLDKNINPITCIPSLCNIDFISGSVAINGVVIPPVTLTGVKTDVSCNGGNDGKVVLTPGGGTGTFTYAWTGPNAFTANTKDISNLKAGKYYITVSSGAATPKVDSFTIAEPNKITVSSKTIVDVNCFGQSTGTVSLTVTGGTSPYTYLWSSGETAANLSNKASGTYFLTVTDAKSCTIKDTSIILQPSAAISITPTITNVKCNAGNDGAISLNVVGGTSPYTFAWTGPNGFTANTKDITALFASDYRVTVTDSKSCAQTSGPLTITQPNAISIGTPSVTNTGCGTSIGAISITPTNGTAPYTFAWTGPNGFTSTNQNIANLVAGSYTVIVRDANSCSTTSSPISVSSSGLNLNVTPIIKNIDCNGNSNGEISITVSGGSGNFSYAWTGPNAYTASTKDISALKAGSYTVAITDVNNQTCQFIPSPYVIIEPSAITVSTPLVTNITCKDGKTGAISITVGGGTPQYSYVWTGPNGFTAVNTSSISDLFAGAYNVTIRDSKGCEKQTSANVTEPATSATFGQPVITNVKCFGASTGSIELPVSGGTLPYSFTWRNSNGSVVGSSAKLENVAAGTYRLEVRDANSCLITSNDLSITQPSAAISIAETIVRANDACNGSITLLVAGGVAPYTFSWTGAGVNASAQNQTDLCPGSYTVTITDANECRSVKSFNVPGTTSPPIRLTDSVITNAGCPGGALGAISINFVGGRAPFTFAWYNVNNPNIVIGILQNIDKLTAGKYYVKISDGIQSYQSGIIEVKGSDTPIKVTLVNVKNESCIGNDGAIDIDVSGGAFPYTYQWDKVVGNIQDLTNIPAGTYSVTVTDINKCAGSLSNIVVERTLCPLVANVSEKKDVKCNGGNEGSVKVNIENGEPGYTIAWGTNSVRVNNIPRKDATYTISNLIAGSYDILITDAKNQTTTIKVDIAQPAAPLAVVPTVVGDSGNCFGSIRLTVTGGTPPYKYRWTDLPGSDHQRDRFDLCAGKILSVEVTDVNGCKVMTDNIRIPNTIPVFSIDPNVIITNANCADDFSKTKIDISVKGGIRPYKYKWSNGSENEDISGVAPGKYRVTATDASLPNPQVAIAEYEVSAISSLKVTVTTTQASGANTNDGTATVTITGGLPTYSVKWCVGAAKSTNDSTLTEKGLAVGACFVEVTDGLGCSKRVDFSIKSTGCAEVRVNTVFNNLYNLKCFADKNASATVVSINDTTIRTPISYRWSTNESGATAVQLPAGSQTVTVTGSNGRSCVASFQIKAPDEMKVDIVSEVTNCCLQAIVRGGVGPLKYTWASLTDTASKICNLKGGSDYYVIVKDANGCETAPATGKAECTEYCLQGGSVITPDDDGVNDEFKIEKCQYANVRLQIFSRWGEMVYQNGDYSNQWQGRSADGTSGNELPEGVYFYVLRALKPNGLEESIKGTVTILRKL